MSEVIRAVNRHRPRRALPIGATRSSGAPRTVGIFDTQRSSAPRIAEFAFDPNCIGPKDDPERRPGHEARRT
jgi:hypothetical protein